MDSVALLAVGAGNNGINNALQMHVIMTMQ